MKLVCDTCRTVIDVHRGIAWRFTERNIPTFLQAVHFRQTYTYEEFPILNKPVKTKWSVERCNGLFKKKE